MKPIDSMDVLRSKLGEPHSLTQQKIASQLFADAQAFIRQSPLVFMSTRDAEGGTTVSPKGDAPGFVRVIDEHTLLIPERPGNKLLHGLSNILETGSIGLLFTIPGTEETLRVNGSAALYEDEDQCKAMEANGKPALLLIKVEVEQCFFHCAKAFKRSKAWQPDTWPEPMKIKFGQQIARNAAKNKLGRAAIAVAVDAAVKADYKHNL